jgi:putative transposase
MLCWLSLVRRLAAAVLKSRRNLLFENAVLRHQLLVLSRNAKRPRLRLLDRALWAWLSRAWNRWRTVFRLAQPDTVIHWHRQGFPPLLEMEEPP